MVIVRAAAGVGMPAASANTAAVVIRKWNPTKRIPRPIVVVMAVAATAAVVVVVVVVVIARAVATVIARAVATVIVRAAAGVGMAANTTRRSAKWPAACGSDSTGTETPATEHEHIARARRPPC